jgi:hypothetical protein
VLHRHMRMLRRAYQPSLPCACADVISHTLEPELKYDSASIHFEDLVLDAMVEVSYSSLTKELEYTPNEINMAGAYKVAVKHTTALRAGATLSVGAAQNHACRCQVGWAGSRGEGAPTPGVRAGQGLV